jgi:hypothetical protein
MEKIINVKKNAVYHMGIKTNIIIINKLIIVLKIVFIKKNQGIVLKIKNADYSINMMEIVIVVQINIYTNINEVKEFATIYVVYYLNIKKIKIVNNSRNG